jgi:hypothetical protein
MAKHQKERLERDLERYRALLRYTTDVKVAEALEGLIRETQVHLNDINNLE